MSAETRVLYGRRKGHKLSPSRSGLLSTRLGDLKLDLAKPAPDNLAALFPVPVEAVRMEVGFGGGEHMLAESLRQPSTGFIGVEPFLNGLGKAVSAIAAKDIRTIRLYDEDAGAVLDWLPAASLERVDILYPDPWPKRRHWKRRFVSQANLDRIARVLRVGGDLRVASDIPGYIEWTLILMAGRTDYRWTAIRADDWRKPWRDWPGTRYEAKALREGRTPAYLIFNRI